MNFKACFYRTFLMLFLLLLFFADQTYAQLKVASLFTDNMVLQQQSNVAIWGWDTPGKNVTVRTSWNGKSYQTKTDADGKWLLKAATPAFGGPYIVTISGGQTIKLNNVLIGEVWLCTGQSNMEMPMKGFYGTPVSGANQAILKSKNNQLRLYTVPRSSVTQPQQNSKPANWQMASPETVSNFSATAYYFGRMLNENLGVPVGLIVDCWGGSTIEAWMSPQSLQTFPEIKIPAKTDSIKNANQTPTTLYNGMFAPVRDYDIKGQLWYQGESNVGRADQYLKLMKAFVQQQRGFFGADMPFYFDQIAPWAYHEVSSQKSSEGSSAFLRDAERIAAEQIPNTGMAVLLDAGEEKNIHPADKAPAGERLALLALAKTYGKKGFEYSSPTYQSLLVNGSIATVTFNDAPNGLTSYQKPLNEFMIAGADQVFYPAQAFIKNNTVVVSSPQVPEPKAVRYAFKDFVAGELFGNGGLPVSSFRTDGW